MTTRPAPTSWPKIAVALTVILTALAILISLGLWQLERKAWKEDLIARIEARAYGEPAALPSESRWPSWAGADDEYRRVRFDGTFLHDKEVLIHGLMPGTRGAPVQGFYVFTPMRLRDGATIVVNRGFVPTELRAPSSRSAGQPGGEVTVTGLERGPEIRGWFLPENQPAREDWFVRDLGSIAAARDLTRLAPFYVDADATPHPGGWPRGGLTRLTLTNDHLQYAFTWFGLALTLIGVAAAFGWRRLRSGPSAAPEPVPPSHAGGSRPPAALS